MVKITAHHRRIEQYVPRKILHRHPWIARHLKACEVVVYRDPKTANGLIDNAAECFGFYDYYADRVYLNANHPGHLCSNKESIATIVHELYHRAAQDVKHIVGWDVDEKMARCVESETLSTVPGRRVYCLRSKI